VSDNISCPRCGKDCACGFVLREHTKAVGQFLNDLYATMIDPVAAGEIKVEEMQRQLLEAARANRQALYDRDGELAEIKKRYHNLLEDWYRLSQERWGNVCATDVFQLLKHEPKYRVVMNLLADGQISVGKCAEAITEIAAGCVARLPEWNGYECELSWKERYESLHAAHELSKRLDAK
jgi:hypothetical protein